MVRLDSHAALGKRQPTCDATAMVTDGNMLELGRNCWRIEHATQATVIVDADEYFKAARAAMLKAKKQILLVGRSEEHTSALQSLMRISYAVFCLKKKTPTTT